MRILKFIKFSRSSALPTRINHRSEGNEAALILIHGFSGNTAATWASIVEFLLREPKLKRWDIYGVGFASSLRLDVPGLWSADPSLTMLAQGLRTSLAMPPFKNYRAFAIAAHSMGGLIIQRALLDDESLASKIDHLFLIGTPSAGLKKASLIGRLKRQLRDMGRGSPFIKALRTEWSHKFGEGPPFTLRVVAGMSDEFVPAESSLYPFPKSTHAAVTGNHLEIVRAQSEDHETFQFIVDCLSGRRHVRSSIDNARIAVELRDFHSAVEMLLPQASQLDDNALVDLALALEETGKRDAALSILEDRYKGGVKSLDAIGTLAGRVKRKWLVDRLQQDLQRSLDLYELGLKTAENLDDHAQAYYHAINIAFLHLISSAPTSDVPDLTRQMATIALHHCTFCAPRHWVLATSADAHLMMGDESKAAECYNAAIAATKSPREIQSMYSQAMLIADRLGGELMTMQIELIFKLEKLEGC